MAPPSKYKQDYCKLLIEHMSQGLSFESFAATCDVTSKCLYDWVMKHDDFAKAKALAEVKCLLFWERLGIGGVAGKIKGFSAPTYVYSMKCRFRKFGWYENEVDDPRKVEDKSELVAKLLTQLTTLIQDKTCPPHLTVTSSQPSLSSQPSSSEAVSATGLLTENDS